MKPFKCIINRHEFEDALDDLQPSRKRYKSIVCRNCHQLIITDEFSLKVLEHFKAYFPNKQ
jgi:hypothetical protein